MQRYTTNDLARIVGEQFKLGIEPDVHSGLLDRTLANCLFKTLFDFPELVANIVMRITSEDPSFCFTGIHCSHSPQDTEEFLSLCALRTAKPPKLIDYASRDTFHLSIVDCDGVRSVLFRNYP